jgi:acetyl-CoA C-acetyltransferase
MEEVVIAGAARTPIGSFGGKLSGFSATQLGSAAIAGAIEKSGIDPGWIDEVILGNVLSANLGQAPARQAALGAGLGYQVPATLINKVCSSGLKAIMFAAQSIQTGDTDCVVAGGMESMSNTPFYLPQARFGQKYGHAEMVDGLLKDGLWETYYQFPMGNCAENTAREMNLTREMQDLHAISSYHRAQEATQKGYFKEEIVPLEIPVKNQDPESMTTDEEIFRVDFNKISRLKPVFDNEGSVTAANSSTINDGAAAMVLMSRSKAEANGIKPLARILSFADAAQDPVKFPTTPALAIPKALKKAGFGLQDVDYFEINEAFSAVVLANVQLLNLDPEKVNVFGGAVAMGHPIGCSGARILVTLLNVLHRIGGRIGVAGICNGGGGASALVIEKL